MNLLQGVLCCRTMSMEQVADRQIKLDAVIERLISAQTENISI